MKPLEEFREKKNGILDDMHSFITYQPSRDNDLLAFMEQYLKTDSGRRPAILEHLRSCMDGKSYPNPYESSYHYTENEVVQCEKILDRYLDQLLESQGDSGAIADCVRQTTCQLGNLNEQCNGALIDSWRRDRLCAFLNDAAEAAGMAVMEDLTYEHRMW